MRGLVLFHATLLGVANAGTGERVKEVGSKIVSEVTGLAASAVDVVTAKEKTEKIELEDTINNDTPLTTISEIIVTEDRESKRFSFGKTDCSIRLRPIIEVSGDEPQRLDLYNNTEITETQGACGNDNIYLKIWFKKDARDDGTALSGILELFMIKRNRKFGRIRLNFFSLANITLTIEKPDNKDTEMTADLKKQTKYDFPVGMILKCFEPWRTAMPTTDSDPAKYAVVLSKTYIIPLGSRTVDERVIPVEDVEEEMRHTTFSCVLDRRATNPGAAPFVMGLIVASLATAGLLVAIFNNGRSSEYEKM